MAILFYFLKYTVQWLGPEKLLKVPESIRKNLASLDLGDSSFNLLADETDIQETARRGGVGVVRGLWRLLRLPAPPIPSDWAAQAQ